MRNIVVLAVQRFPSRFPTENSPAPTLQRFGARRLSQVVKTQSALPEQLRVAAQQLGCSLREVFC
jgi:hypothetical protein